ncbi:MAG TPA: aldo/keto reductase, partial [Vicinamibacteria bacterium]
ARGFLSGSRKRGDEKPTARARSDEFADKLYFRDEDFDVLDALLEVAQARDVPPARVALAWLLSRPGVVAPIVGATKLPHLEDAAAALEVRLSGDEIARLEAPYQPHPILGHDQPTPRDAAGR